MIDSGSLLETIKSLILDYQEMELPTGVPRRLRIETVPGKATVRIGARRGGKSTYLYSMRRPFPVVGPLDAYRHECLEFGRGLNSFHCAKGQPTRTRTRL